ncbi:peptidoglycan-binding protein [Streptomyces carpaticus]|uniref:peptidoglycan-binding protein n=1 Tax=Streptomyces carpaticus TaxID=285558 RepID=UPI00220A73B0|nr:peptidoglycan-binding protein [Streptomyces carpaticus]
MATPLTADKLLAALRAEGVKVIEYKSWRTHNRNSRGAWGPVNGVMIHHTASTGTAASVDLCYDGYAGLPGPLCHGVVDKSGTVYMVGHGRANHAGSGDRAVLDRLIAETPPYKPTVNNTDGNARMYGFEAVNLGDGKDPWPEAQLDAIERVSAAICRAHGWTAGSVLGHLEWQRGKVDPRGFDMTTMRERVERRLKVSPGARPAAPRFEPFPGADFFRRYPRSPIVTAMGRRLVAEGCSAYAQGPGPQWTVADKNSYAKWQRKCGFTGADADGWPGRVSWDRLKVPKV